MRRTSSRHQKHPAVCGTSTAGSRGRNFLGGGMVNGARRKVRRLFSTAWPRYALDDAAQTRSTKSLSQKKCGHHRKRLILTTSTRLSYPLKGSSVPSSGTERVTPTRSPSHSASAAAASASRRCPGTSAAPPLARQPSTYPRPSSPNRRWLSPRARYLARSPAQPARRERWPSPPPRWPAPRRRSETLPPRPPRTRVWS